MECNRAFAHRSYLVEHVKRVHQQMRQKQCKICNTAFFSNSELNNHTQSIHKVQAVKLIIIFKLQPNKRGVTCKMAKILFLWPFHGRYYLMRGCGTKTKQKTGKSPLSINPRAVSIKSELGGLKVQDVNVTDSHPLDSQPYNISDCLALIRTYQYLFQMRRY